MLQNLIFMETGSTDPAYNLAFEEYVLEHYLNGPVVILWQNENAIVVGVHQNTEAEVSRSFAEAHGIKVVRRMTGGGAVYHDLGNLNYSFITDAEPSVNINASAFSDGQDADREPAEISPESIFVSILLKTLYEIGVEAYISGRNDILVNGCKISGTAARIHNGRILYHGTLLFDTNLEMLSGALTADPLKYQAKGISSVRSRVGNIRTFLKEDMTMAEFIKRVRVAYTGNDGMISHLSPGEKAAVEQLKQTKYDTFEWTYGCSRTCHIRNKKRYAGGILEPRITLDRGCITAVEFCGDYLSKKPVDELTAALVGCRYDRERVKYVLERFDIEQYMGDISLENVLDVMFNLM